MEASYFHSSAQFCAWCEPQGSCAVLSAVVVHSFEEDVSDPVVVEIQVNDCAIHIDMLVGRRVNDLSFGDLYACEYPHSGGACGGRICEESFFQAHAKPNRFPLLFEIVALPC